MNDERVPERYRVPASIIAALPGFQRFRAGDLVAAAARHPDDVGAGEGGWPGIGILMERFLDGQPPVANDDAPELAEEPRGGPADTTYTVDIHPTYQAGLTVPVLMAGGIAALACKVTEGTGLYKAGYHAFSNAAQAGGLPFSAYHFLRSENPGADQAAWCKQGMAGDWGRIPVMLDWETSVSGTRAGVATANAFITEVRRLGGLITLNYLPRWYWSAIGSPDLTGGPVGSLGLVQSAYGTNPAGSPAGTYPGNASSRWAGFGGLPASMLQFGSNMRLPGYSGPLDVNAFRGTRTEMAMRGWFGPSSATPPEADMSEQMIIHQDDPSNARYRNPGAYADGNKAFDAPLRYLLHFIGMTVSWVRREGKERGATLATVQTTVNGTGVALGEVAAALARIEQKVGGELPPVDVDKLAAALAANPTLLAAVAKAVNDDAARRQVS